MATEPRKRNNARKAAARAVQKANPGISYLDALSKVSDPAVVQHVGLSIATLLGIASADDVRERHARDELTLAVPLGVSATGQHVILNVAAFHDPGQRDGGGVGPHGVIVGEEALSVAGGIVAALHAVSPPHRLQVALIGTAHQVSGADIAADQVVIRDPADASPPGELGAPESFDWQRWVDGELYRRSALARDAGVSNLCDCADVARLVICCIDDGTYTATEWDTVKHIGRHGRSLGVHLLVLQARTATPAERGRLFGKPQDVFCNFTFRIDLDGAENTATITVFSPEEDRTEHFRHAARDSHQVLARLVAQASAAP